MSLMLRPIIDQLKYLETPQYYRICALNDQFQYLNIYLLATSNDKPANCMIQMTPEPTGEYGCSKCEIDGTTEYSNKINPETSNLTPAQLKNRRYTHKIRIFSTAEMNKWPTKRTTERYLYYLKIYNDLLSKQPLPSQAKVVHETHGYIGECLLLELEHFDYSTGFLIDTLHSVFHGVWKRLLRLWFAKESKNEPYSLFYMSKEIDEELNYLRYPSTTTRVPTTIIKYARMKANELRVALFTGMPILKHYLPEQYYRHAQLLTCSIFVSENREISTTAVDIIRECMETFIDYFGYYYGKRNVVQTVHCVLHLPDTVHEFGPVYSYRQIANTLHGCRQQPQEMANSLNLIKLTSILANTHCLNSNLFDCISYLQGLTNSLSVNVLVPSKQSKVTPTDKNKFDEMFGKDEYVLYKKLVVNNVTYVTNDATKSKTFADAAILFKTHETNRYGIITKIIFVKQTNEYRLQIVELENLHFEKIYNTNNRIYDLENIIYGQLDMDRHHRYIKPQNVVEKVCYYYRGNVCYFVRFPNLVESS
ncbi:unnamed protein product [Didymodactylos carnosus]|nr:unnamed protein product [Didymodactylos carnosus]CAF4124664.1 unnamed protein product [Didymodactylos carnosus]